MKHIGHQLQLQVHKLNRDHIPMEIEMKVPVMRFTSQQDKHVRYDYFEMIRGKQRQWCRRNNTFIPKYYSPARNQLQFSMTLWLRTTGNQQIAAARQLEDHNAMWRIYNNKFVEEVKRAYTKNDPERQGPSTEITRAEDKLLRAKAHLAVLQPVPEPPFKDIMMLQLRIGSTQPAAHLTNTLHHIYPAYWCHTILDQVLILYHIGLKFARDLAELSYYLDWYQFDGLEMHYHKTVTQIANFEVREREWKKVWAKYGHPIIFVLSLPSDGFTKPHKILGHKIH